MTPRRTLLAVAAAVAVAGTMQPASARPGKPINGSYTHRDATPDPTGNAESDETRHCNGKLPQEQPFKFKAPAAGKLKVAISEFQGDWTLQIKDAKGVILGGDDVNPPEYESATVTIKKAGDILILPCNLGGTFDAKVKYTFTPK